MPSSEPSLTRFPEIQPHHNGKTDNKHITSSLFAKFLQFFYNALLNSEKGQWKGELVVFFSFIGGKKTTMDVRKDYFFEILTVL